MSGKNDSNLGNKIVFSENLNYYISKTGVKQRDIAKVVGVSEGTVCDWLKRRSYPRMDKIQLLAEYWDIQMSDLVEERSVYNQYYLKKEVDSVATYLESHLDILLTFKKFQKLSAQNKAIVKALIESLAGDKK